MSNFKFSRQHCDQIQCPHGTAVDSNQRARVISDTIGNVLSRAGTRDNFQSARRTYEVWLIALE